jgi:hypothetical protein
VAYDPLEYALRKQKDAGTRITDVFSRLMALDKILVGANFPPMSPWWKTQLRKFYKTGRRRLVARVGRRGGKSTTICRWAVAEALYGGHKIPPGDVGEVVIISTGKVDARKRVTAIEAILDAIGEPYTSSSERIVLTNKAVHFVVYAANWKTAVGMTTIFLFCDEMARWNDDEMGANPAREVLKSVMPSLLTQKLAKMAFSSSPWSTLDAHHDYFERGDDDLQMTAHAESWIANPSTTEQECRDLDPAADADEETFDREFRAIPMSSALRSFFDPHAIENALVDAPFWRDMTDLPALLQVGARIKGGVDFAFVSDYSALYIEQVIGGVAYPLATDVLRPRPGMPLKPSETCARFGGICKALGLDALMADMHYRESIVEHLEPFDVAFIDAPKTVAPQYILFRTQLYQEKRKIPNIKGLVEDLKAVQHSPSANSGINIILPRSGRAKKGREYSGGHADLLSAMVLAANQVTGKLVTDPGEVEELYGWNLEELAEVRVAGDQARRMAGLTGEGAIYGEEAWLPGEDESQGSAFWN